MIKRLAVLSSVFIFLMANAACLGGTPAGSSDQVATIVASTLQALPPAEVPTDTPADAVPPEANGGLPRSLYYLAPDGGGLLQIHRMATDGVTTTQLTFEPATVSSFDVNPADGRLVFVANNQLVLVAGDGSGRQLLMDCGPTNQEEPYLNRVSSPRWALDGNTIAFGCQGLNFYTLSVGTYVNVLPNVYDQTSGFSIPRELFSPSEYSPDGSMLLLSISWYEGGTYAIYLPATNTLVRPDHEGIFCCSETWSADSSAVYVASPFLGMISSGLWRFNPDGRVDVLIPSEDPPGTFHFAAEAYLGPGDQLYYFYASLPNYPDSGSTPLTLVRSAADGVTGRTPVLVESFADINQALWLPDASGVIVVQPTAPDMYYGGQATLFYTDGRLAVPLLPFAQDMRWGP
ncbi:MAG: hypothetical protein JXB85_11645 [Anaerolineales bacterium]|nr:hypothetical protein [Anaerolineales bacterium]